MEIEVSEIPDIQEIRQRNALDDTLSDEDVRDLFWVKYANLRNRMGCDDWQGYTSESLDVFVLKWILDSGLESSERVDKVFTNNVKPYWEQANSYPHISRVIYDSAEQLLTLCCNSKCKEELRKSVQDLWSPPETEYDKDRLLYVISKLRNLNVCGSTRMATLLLDYWKVSSLDRNQQDLLDRDSCYHRCLRIASKIVDSVVFYDD